MQVLELLRISAIISITLKAIFFMSGATKVFPLLVRHVFPLLVLHVLIICAFDWRKVAFDRDVAEIQ